MNHDRTYRSARHVPAPRLRDADNPIRPHTYGVRVCSCTSIATEPCRPTACAGEYPCCTFTHPATAHYSLLTANSTYTFSAKEKDSETGLSYFGSRYYSSDLSVWLSVDPMSDKYPLLSPFVYCANNPVRCVDPNGEEIGDIYNIFGVHIGFDGKLDGKVYLYNTWSSKQLSLTESATLTSSPRADVVNVTEKYGLYNYELNLRATLSMLKKAEAGSSNTPLAYNSWNSGDVFTTHSYTASPKDYQGHPGINPNSKSSAAGAYQFLWRFYTMPDFSPTNQDKAALRLMTTKGYNAAILGNVRSFVEECQERWTSLKEWSIEDLQSTFNAYRAMELHGFSNIATPIGHLCR